MHSPSPFRIDDLGRIYDADDENAIARLYLTPAGHQKRVEPFLSNARLFLVAPELLALAKALVSDEFGPLERLAVVRNEALRLINLAERGVIPENDGITGTPAQPLALPENYKPPMFADGTYPETKK